MRHKTAVIVTLVSLVILVISVTWGVNAIADGNDRTEPILALASFVVSALAMLVSLRQSGGAPTGPVTQEQAEGHATTLAAEVKALTAAEANIRGLVEDQLDPVSWAVHAAPAAGDALAAALPEGGDLSRLIDGFAACSGRRRLVVVGDPGSGKTSLSLLLTLALTEPVSSRPIPVLLPLSSWEPGTTLREWISSRMIEEYPFLLSDPPLRPGRTVEALFHRELVLPVLDGLDEIAAERREAALRAIDEDTWTRSYVLTSRTGVFTAADARLLHRPLVVRLLPVEAVAAARFLTERGDGERLGPLLTALSERPDGPLAAALSTPFMLFLALTHYRYGRPLPAALLAEGTREEIEHHLISALITTVFAPDPNRRGIAWNPDRAEKWLAFLAAHLRKLGTTELAWWEMHKAVRRWVFRIQATVLGAAGCAPLGLLIFGLFGRPWFGLLFGLVVGAVGATVTSSARQEPPRQAAPGLLNQRVTARSLTRSAVFGGIGAVTGALIVGILYAGPGYTVFSAVAFGLCFGVARLINLPAVPTQAGTPDGFLRNERIAVLYGWGLGAVSGLLIGGVLGFSMKDALRGNIRQELERQGAWILTLDTWQHTLLGAGVGAVLAMGGLGMIVQATSALGRFTTTRLWLRLDGRTPLRLMTFLREAYRRGILRRTGPYYQFRHQLLEEYLSRPRSGPGRTAPSASSGSDSPAPPEPDGRRTSLQET
ncbi:hypothetical protein [Nonomuraea sp. SBT364]|uniref:hypothetical protein n=1 Tax=Nonomuraea sp. SBT364 TaxID=1580530 RepID=UPI00066C96E5|nr:hypothetical protein [Nonomuraea sp. SBT364]